MHPRITAVRVRAHYVVDLAFADGTKGTVDLGPWIRDREGMFAPLQDPAFFAKVWVDHEAGTIMWPNDVDLDPDMLYEVAHGFPISPPGEQAGS